MNGEAIILPNRIYFNDNILNSSLPEQQKEILNCVFSRHHNGFIRQKYIHKIIPSNNYWVTPFLLTIMGEYVIEILVDIYNNFSILNKENIKYFFSENPNFYNILQSKFTSYWSCYYKQQYPKNTYVGFKLLDELNNIIGKRK